MSKRLEKASKSTATLPSDYAPLLADIKARVQTARIKAGLAANRELLALYWDIGRLILDRQKREGWGAKVIDRLAADLQREFPGQQGFSPRNLKYMRAFAEAWPETVIVQQAGAQLADANLPQAVTDSSTTSAEIVQQPVGQLRHRATLRQRLAIVELLLRFTPCSEQKSISFSCAVKHATPH